MSGNAYRRMVAKHARMQGSRAGMRQRVRVKLRSTRGFVYVVFYERAHRPSAVLRIRPRQASFSPTARTLRPRAGPRSPAR
jgi:hypothetical protein